MTPGKVYSREPFISGSSKVITVTGIPAIPNNKKSLFKQVNVDENDCCLVTPYDEIHEPDLEEMSSELEFKSTESAEEIGTFDSVKQLVCALEYIGLEGDEQLTLMKS